MKILHFLPFKLKTQLVIGLLFLFQRLINYFLIIKKATVWWVWNKFFWRKALLLDIVIHCKPLQKCLTKYRKTHGQMQKAPLLRKKIWRIQYQLTGQLVTLALTMVQVEKASSGKDCSRDQASFCGSVQKKSWTLIWAALVLHTEQYHSKI